MKRTTIRNIVSTAAFLLLTLVVLYNILNTTLIDRNSFYIRSLKDVSKADVIAVGSSHAYCTINSLELWNQYGLISQNAALGGATTVNNYFLIKNILNEANPKVIVAECFKTTKEFSEVAGVAPENHFMPARVTFPKELFSYDMIQYSLDTYPENKKYSLKHYFFPEIVFHSRWSQLRKNDFAKVDEYKSGFYINHKVYPIKDIVSENKVPQLEGDFLDPVQLEYLIKTIELCKSKDVDLVLMVAPYSPNMHPLTKANWQEVVQAYRDMSKIAEQYDVPYINYFDLVDDIGINYGTDFFDSDHLNYYGAEKLTKHLGQYLVDNYELTDKRENPDYAYMWDNYADFLHQTNNSELPNLVDAERYFNILSSNENYVVSMSLRQKPNGKLKIPNKVSTQMNNLGVDIAKIGLPITGGGGYILLANNGKIEYEGNVSDYSTLVDYTKFEIESSTTKSSIKIAGVEKSKNKYGLNITVYDPITEAVIDSVVVDIYNDCNMTRK